MRECIRFDRDCADLCRLAAALMGRDTRAGAAPRRVAEWQKERARSRSPRPTLEPRCEPWLSIACVARPARVDGARDANPDVMATQKNRWSARVTRESDALTLEEGVFKKGSARAIAASLKRSAERSRRKKSDSFRSAMSMLTFFINRAGRGLSPTRRRVLERAKDELRALFGRKPQHAHAQ